VFGGSAYSPHSAVASQFDKQVSPQNSGATTELVYRIFEAYKSQSLPYPQNPLELQHAPFIHGTSILQVPSNALAEMLLSKERS
jgi:hypothetical protein